MDHFRRLEARLKDLLSRPSENIEYPLYQALEEAKPLFLRLLDISPRSAAEKAEIESGKFVIRGGASVFNDDFKHETLFLAQELDGSERFCAQLLDHVIRSHPASSRSGIAETALFDMHQERAALLACLRLIIENAARKDAPNTKTLRILQNFASDLIQGSFDMGRDKPKGNMASKLLSEIDVIHSNISKQRDTLRNVAPSSSTLAQPSVRTTSFSSVTIEARIRCLQHERRQFGHIVYLIAASGQLSANDITTLVKWLSRSKDLSEGLTLQLLTSFLAAVNPGYTPPDGGEEGSDIYHDRQLFVDVNATLNASNWGIPSLRAAMLLQWSLFVLEVRSRDPNLLGDYVVVEDEVGTMAKDAIRLDAFQALTTFVIRSRGVGASAEAPEFHLAPDDSVVSGKANHLDGFDHQDHLDSDFRHYLVVSIENLIISLIRRMSRVLRDIRKQEEDIALYALRNARTYSPPRASNALSVPPPTPRRDIETLFRLIAIIYDELPLDAAIKFWTDDDGGRLFPFLKWAAESRQSGMIVGMYDMFSTLAKGPDCAAFTYNFLSTGGGQYATSNEDAMYGTSSSCSWSTLFMALHHYEAKMPGSRIVAPTGPSNPIATQVAGSSLSSEFPRFALYPEEILMLSSFLRLLRNVARYSVTARIALYENPDFRAVQSLFNLTAYSIPLELKAMLFDTLSAFSTPGGGSVGKDMTHQMWAVLEKMEIIPVRGSSTNVVFPNRIGRSVGGAVVELELIESVGKTYPATTALVNLINSLIHTPGKALTLRKGFEIDSQTIPDHLGAGYRFPGLRPYVDFIIDKVFLKIFDRQYAFPLEQWQVFDACLCFIEKSLTSFDLTVLHGEEFSTWRSGNPVARAKAASILANLATHPGFFVLKHILSHPVVRHNLLYVVDDGFSFSFENVSRSYPLKKSALRSLRIIHRIFQIQGIFAEVLIPLLNEAGDLPGIGNMGFPVSSILPLDLSILQRPTIIPHIAMYVTLTESELPLFAIKVLTGLSESSYSNNLHTSTSRPLNLVVAALRESSRLDVILVGFVQWLGAVEEEEYDSLDEGLEVLIEDVPGYTAVPLAQTVRSAILQLLLQNTQPNSPAPNIAHVLLGLEYRGPTSDMLVEDPMAAKSSRSCLHAVLDLLGQGIPREDQEESVVGTPLYKTHPTLAEKCYQLVGQLCVHPLTSAPVVRYLRSREHFFLRQLIALPMKVPAVDRGSVGKVIYLDGTHVDTTCGALTGFLRLRSSILQSVALEIHILTESKQNVRAEHLAEVFLDTPGDSDQYAGLVGDIAPIPGQTLIRALEFLESLCIDWVDSLAPAEGQIHVYKDVNWNSCLRTDEHGCQIYDFRPLISSLASTRRRLQQQGSLSANGIKQQLREETHYVLKVAAAANHRNEVDHAKSAGFSAWATLLNISLLKAFDRMPRERSEAILYGILRALPPCIMAPTTPSATAVVLSTTLVSLITKLRGSLQRHSLLRNAATDNFASAPPNDRLHALFKHLLECTLQQGTTEKVRGNLYASLINYLHIALAPSHGTPSVNPRRSSEESTSIELENGAGLYGSQAHDTPGGFSSLASGTLSIVNIVVDRLVPLVCKDATDGSEVWKTVAFTLLNLLIRLSRNDRSYRVLAVMVKGGYLQTLLQSLRESGADLLQILQPDPASLNALYVYEAKMSLLVRIAQTRQGAERLVESRVFGCLAQSEFLAARPVTTPDFLHHDAFLPTAIERYHQLVIPVLQLAVSCLSAIGPSVSAVAKQALEFVFAHRETLAGLLVDRLSHISYATMRECQLIVTLSSLVLPEIKEPDLMDPVYFKPIHAAICSLGSKCLNKRRWDPAVTVTNQSEREDLTSTAPGYGESGSLFGQKLSSSSRLLQRWMIIYFTAVCDLSNTFKPVLQNQFPPARGTDLASHVRNKAPTISDAIAALNGLVQDLGDVLGQIQNISTKFHNIDQLTPEEIEEIALRVAIDREEEFDLIQKKALAWKELEEAFDRRRSRLLEDLHSVELLLLLIWRHLVNCFGPQVTRGPQSVSADVASKAALREESASSLIPVLNAIDDLKLELVLDHGAVASRRAFFELFSRRLRETVTGGEEWVEMS